MKDIKAKTKNFLTSKYITRDDNDAQTQKEIVPILKKESFMKGAR